MLEICTSPVLAKEIKKVLNEPSTTPSFMHLAYSVVDRFLILRDPDNVLII